MKAIILAAGRGTRMGKYTEGLPKCMLKFDGKTLIETQIETLRDAGIRSIIVVKGYMPEKITPPGIKYYINTNFSDTNMVETLMCAEQEMDDDVIVCYGDILYEKKIIEKAISSDANIGVIVDTDYLEYWKSRSDEWYEDVESLIVDHGNIVEIGIPNCPLENAKSRYVGIIKFSKEGVGTLKKVYHKNREKYFDKNAAWMASTSFKNAYMTCMLNAIIKEGYNLTPIVINRGWIEFDTAEDYELATKWLINGSIKKFYNPQG